MEFRNYLGTWEWHPREPAPLAADAEEDERLVQSQIGNNTISQAPATNFS